MAEFFNVQPPEVARHLFGEAITHQLPTETIATAEALGRVTAVALTAPHALPQFRRSTMDGYAVRAEDTYGASGNLPAFLRVVGEVAMGRPALAVLAEGTAVVVHTGGMIPDSGNAVVQIEHTQPVGADEIEVLKGVAVGQNVLQVGEDVAQGAVLFPAGHRLRPQDIGGLLALGLVEVAVRQKPKVAILATGDEVIPPDQTPQAGQIRDINSYTTAAQTRQAGGVPLLRGIVGDAFEALLTAARAALAEADMLVLSAGSSVSVRDMTLDVINALGQPGVILHGIATRPGKPTIVGVVDGKPVLGLPGNPVSAMIQFDMLGVPAIHQLQGLAQRPRRAAVWARLAANIPSESGREDYVPVQLVDGMEGVTAVPVFGKSNLIYTLVHADGVVKVPLNDNGLVAGQPVEVALFE